MMLELYWRAEVWTGMLEESPAAALTFSSLLLSLPVALWLREVSGLTLTQLSSPFQPPSTGFGS